MGFHRVQPPEAANERGTGLGLSIARSIVELHRGRAWRESEPGQGSAFFFALPAAYIPAAIAPLGAAVRLCGPESRLLAEERPVTGPSGRSLGRQLSGGIRAPVTTVGFAGP